MDKEKRNSIFESDIWFNATCATNWQRIEIKDNNDKVYASLPVFYTKRFGRKIATIPPFAQTCGISIKETGAKLSKQLEKEKKIINDIICKIPKDYSIDLFLDVRNQYVLPFLWKGFSIKPRYTYRIDNLSDTKIIWSGLKENIRTDIRKAERLVTVYESLNIDIVIQLMEKTFNRQGRRFPYDKYLLKNLHENLMKANACKILYAADNEHNIHAATYYVYDEDRCYYLLSGGDPKYRSSGATSLLVWEGIKFAQNNSKVFDFEGSMIESIERFVRSFGAKPYVYYNVQKLKPILKVAEFIKPFVKKILKYK